MLSTSFDAQHGARCWRSISHSGLVISSIGLQHRCCTLLQPCRPSEIVKVCGGNAGALLRAAGFSRSLGGWEAALSQVAKDIWRSMKLGYRPATDAGYTATDFAKAVKAILESKYNAVNDDDLEAVVGQLPLEAMLRANLLALRPYSPWATDIHVEAFGPHQRYTLVTAPTSLHLYLMKAERSIILAALNTQQVPPEDSTNHSAGASRPASPESDAVRAVIDQLTAVQGKIDAVDKQIEEVHEKVTSIMQTEKKGWQTKLAYWERKKQQLVEDKRQLREEEKLLQKQKLALSKREQ